MKQYQKLLSAVLGACLLLAGCADARPSSSRTSPAARQSSQDAPSDSSAGEVDMSGELILLGPGKFSEVGPDGVTDPISGLFRPGYNEIVEMWKAKYPGVTLKIEAIPWDSYQAKMQTAAAGNMVDVLMHGAVVLDAAEDLNAYIEKTPGLVDKLFLGTAVRHKYEDNYDFLAVTGIPATISPAMLMLDKQLFQDFGVELPTADTLTWDGLLEFAGKLTGTNPRTGQPCYGFYPFKVDDSNIFKNLFAVNWAKDVNAFVYHKNKAETELRFTTPESIEALGFLNRLIQFTPPGYMEGLGNEKQASAENDVAIYMSEDLMLAYDKTVANGVEDRFAYLPVPRAGDDKSYTSHSGDWNLAIANTSSKKDMAWEFIKYMVTDPQVQDWFIRINAIPNNRDGFQKYLDSGRPYVDAIKRIYDEYPQDFCYTSCQYWNTSFGPSNSVLANSLGEMFAGKQTPEECARSIQNGLEEYLDSLA